MPWLKLAAALALLVALGWRLRRRLQRAALRSVYRMRREGLHLNPITVTRKQKLRAELLEDPAIAALVAAQAAERGLPEEVLWAEVHLYLDEIIPSFHLLTTYGFGKRVAGALLRFCYRIRIGRSAEAALARIPKGASVVYVMNHRSNADYLLVAFLLSHRVAISYAVGEWARVWPLDRIFKAFGSFFVRRRFRDPLYHGVLERYVQRTLEQGVTQGIFLEGGLTRDGGLQPPKLGLLDYMLRARVKGGPERLVFVPVGLNYDRVMEDSNLVREAGGAPRRGPLGLLGRTGLWLLGLAWRGGTGRFHRFGYAVANFGAPLTAQELLDGAPLDGPWPARKEAVARAAARLEAALAREIPLTPVSVVAWVMFAAGTPDLTRRELQARCLAFMARASERGQPLYLARGTFESAVARGLQVLLLRGILRAEGDRLRVAPERADLLAYYARSVAHHAKAH